VAAQEAAARRAAATLELERANAASDVTLGAGVRRFEEGGDLAGVFSISVPLAIFDGNEGAIARAGAEARAAELRVADARRRHEINLVKREEDAARARIELETLRKDLLPRARQALAAARKGYEAGAFAYHEVAEARRIFDDAVAREIMSLRELHIAHAALDRLMGESAHAKAEEAKP
jgi:cobalt-zinc-cadmium efflux system outer membrane protein